MDGQGQRQRNESRLLDARQGRDVVYCHECGHNWYRDEGGLTCPACSGDATEIVEPHNDPRPQASRARPQASTDFESLRQHQPWQNEDVGDPDEEDIENINIGRNFNDFPRRARPSHFQAPPDIASDFQRMVAGMIGPSFGHDQARGGPADPFRQGPMPAMPTLPGGWTGHTSSFAAGPVRGTSFTYTWRSGPQTSSASQPQRGAQPQVLEGMPQMLASLLGNITGGQPGQPNGLAGPLGEFLAIIGNPANAQSGDAVFTQEAFDRVVTDLMAQNPSSSAPAPASADAIANLPKIKVGKKILGEDDKAECSVCMESVVYGDEVVELPCGHWFHQECAEAWLREHNTCPICRKGIGSGAGAGAGAGPGGMPPAQPTASSGPPSYASAVAGTTPTASSSESRGSQQQPYHRSQSDDHRNHSTRSSQSPDARRRGRLDRIRSAAGF